MIPINRQVTEVTRRETERVAAANTPVDLWDTRNDYAYVLLGDPGLGKTTVFKQETEVADAIYRSARDFLVLPLDRYGSAGKTLFIDALDETRAGVQDGRTVLDQIRIKLLELGVPKFRLSCREADWLGNSDRDALAKILHDKSELKVYRLELLSDADVKALLQEEFHVDDPLQFVQHAERVSVDSLLRNPQTLKMLVKAVRSGEEWPESRASAYELACNTLATESNEEHQSAKRKSWPNTTALLDAAGLISAVFLCADRSEIQLARDEASDPKALILLELGNDQKLPVKEAIETNLFTAVRDNMWVPAHRSIAEFLAARYIAQSINNGLSPVRATSLMLGADAGVITSLRGLSAWLATCSSAAREHLIDADPQGVLLYGDVKAFATSDKVFLLECFRASVADNRWRSADDWDSFALGALVAPEMSKEFVRILRAPGRDRSDQVLADLVVTALTHGARIDGVDATLLDVVRDASRRPEIRRYALRTYLRSYVDSDATAFALFEEVATGRLADDDDELLGILLRHLYPGKLSVSKALAHLRTPKSPRWFGSFWRFWDSVCLGATPSNQLPELLDSLADRTRLPNDRGNETYWQFSGQGLLRGVEELGDDTDDEQLYRWLGITLGEADHDHLENELRKRLHDWLGKRPERFMRLLGFAIAHLSDDDRLWRAQRRLHDAKWPARVNEKLLVLAATEVRPKVADDLFWSAAYDLYDPKSDNGITLEQLEDWTAQNPKFDKAFEQFRRCEIDDWRVEQANRRADERREKHERIEQYREALLAKPPSEFNVQGLHYLSLTYAGWLHEARGENPLERLRDFLGNDEKLVEQAITAIDAVLVREDLPTPDQVLTSYLNNKEWLLARPLLVSLDRAAASSPSEICKLPETVLCTALMASYAVPVERDVSFRKLLAAERPLLVADIFSRYAIAALNAGKSTLTGGHEIADDKSFTEVARLVLPETLSRFPRRATLDQLYDLARFIKSFVSSFGEKEALDMVASKLALKTLDVGQRTYWLATGLILAPKKYEKRMRKWASGNEIRVGHLGNYLDRRDQVVRNLGEMPASVVGMLVELLAPHSRPGRPDEDGVYQVTPDMRRGDLIASWINDLAARSSDEAKQELARLQALSGLLPWANAIRTAQARQTIVQRDANYQFPAPDDVLSTLSQGKPANVADLHAILVDNLQQIAAEIERSDLDIYKQYWNQDVSPKIEEAARNALCDRLRVRLAKNDVICAPEARHVDQTRSDILCSHGSFCVPIEVKNQMHREIWKAIRDQLTSKYTIDPRTGGYGVYLVFWYGPTHKLMAPETGRKPKTATELKLALESTLSELQRKFIAICVIDVSVEGRRG